MITFGVVGSDQIGLPPEPFSWLHNNWLRHRGFVTLNSQCRSAIQNAERNRGFDNDQETRIRYCTVGRV